MSSGLRAHYIGQKLARSDLEFYDLQTTLDVVHVVWLGDLHSSSPLCCEG